MSEENNSNETIQGSWLKIANGHPKGLMTLFFSEMWERFCYYGMRTILMLYLVKSLMKGDAEAALIYGAYTGLVYAAPILGGRMADRFLGYRYAVMLGAILMAIGEFLIIGGTDQFLLIGMGALIIGNGYFKANISTIVGKLYGDNDPRRDSGFTIFYIGINVGAFLATSVVAYVGETYGFDKGFALAGIGMLAGLIIFWTNRKDFGAAPGLNITDAGKKKVLGPFSMVQVITAGSLLLIPLLYLLILRNDFLDYIFLGLFVLVVASLVMAGVKADKETKDGIWTDRMIALAIFMVINIVFWACFEQAGTSLTLFADRNVDRSIFGWQMPASMTQVFNPVFIIIFGSIFSQMWIKLSERGKNPSIPMKFAYGILQLGIGFLVTYLGYQMAEDNLVPILTLVFLYLLHTTGELFLSPIGLSMVTKLSPKNIAGTAMGAWFLSFAIANFLGGKIAAMTGGGHHGAEAVVEGFSDKSTLMDAADEASTVSFDEWESLISADIKKPYDLGKNITYGTYLKVRDWVEFREGLANNMSLSDWLAKRSSDTARTADEWLKADEWKSLGSRYEALAKADLADEENPHIAPKDWYYYRGSVSEWEAAEGVSLADAFDAQRDKVQSESLTRYVDIFTKLGLVLIGISILIMLVSKPIKKLMHGVE